jgi:hypothetical protein
MVARNDSTLKRSTSGLKTTAMGIKMAWELLDLELSTINQDTLRTAHQLTTLLLQEVLQVKPRMKILSRQPRVLS